MATTIETYGPRVQAHFIDPSEDSEESLHSFQGKSARRARTWTTNRASSLTTPNWRRRPLGRHLAKAAGTPLSNFKTLLITLVITSTALSHTFTLVAHLHLERIHIPPSVFEHDKKQL
ncbi:hypothetical protein TYRP_009378 [Tyrophagus putrescentiae]|nr:hypothetical protein TYRP_009378 [Tyrophagus putrescentiae]